MGKCWGREVVRENEVVQKSIVGNSNIAPEQLLFMDHFHSTMELGQKYPLW